MEKYWRIATRAANPELLYSNARAMLSSNYWTVEYLAVFDALKRLAADEFREEDLEFAIWKQDNEVWNACELWRMHEIMNDQQEITPFKTFLTQSGKQELLTIWEEMLSCTSSLGEFIERSKAYQVMVDKFAREGLDYETVWSQVSEKTPTIFFMNVGHHFSALVSIPHPPTSPIPELNLVSTTLVSTTEAQRLTSITIPCSRLYFYSNHSL